MFAHNANEFKELKKLNSGISGEVAFYAYTGSNQEIIALRGGRENEKILIKQKATGYENEVKEYRAQAENAKEQLDAAKSEIEQHKERRNKIDNHDEYVNYLQLQSDAAEYRTNAEAHLEEAEKLQKIADKYESEAVMREKSAIEYSDLYKQNVDKDPELARGFQADSEDEKMKAENAAAKAASIHKQIAGHKKAAEELNAKADVKENKANEYEKNDEFRALQKERKELETKIKGAKSRINDYKEKYDKNIKKAEETEISIKNAEDCFHNEWNILRELSDKTNSGHGALLRPKVRAVLIHVDGREEKFILNECIYSDHDRKTSMNYQNYLIDLGNDHKNRSHAGAGLPADQANLFHKQFISLIAAQMQLHQDGILHLDTAPRNFVMTPDGTLKIIDFGLSSKMDKETGKAIDAKRYKMEPVHTYDNGAVKHSKNKSVSTDLFACRTAIMEAMALYMGVPREELADKLHLSGLQGAGKEALLSKSDQDRLANSLQNLRRIAVDLQRNKDPRGDMVLQMINRYEKYLTSMPAGKTYQEIERNEMRALEQAGLQYEGGRAALKSSAGMMQAMGVSATELRAQLANNAVVETKQVPPAAEKIASVSQDVSQKIEPPQILKQSSNESPRNKR